MQARTRHTECTCMNIQCKGPLHDICRVHAYIFTHVCTNLHVHVHVHTMYIFTHVCTNLHVHVHTLYMYTCIYMYRHQMHTVSGKCVQNMLRMHFKSSTCTFTCTCTLCITCNSCTVFLACLVSFYSASDLLAFTPYRSAF